MSELCQKGVWIMSERFQQGLLGQVKLRQVKSGQVESGQVESRQVKSRRQVWTGQGRTG